MFLDTIAVKLFRAGPPLGRSLPDSRPSLPETEFGGIYGSGVSGSGDPAMKLSGSKQNGALSTRDVVEYYTLQADAGDASAQLVVGQVFYQGAEGVPQDYLKARKYLQMAFRQQPAVGSKPTKGASEKTAISGQAAAHLGQIYWRGEGVAQNNVTARKWFEKGAVVNNAVCLNALGMMYEDGIAELEKVYLSATIYTQRILKKRYIITMKLLRAIIQTRSFVWLKVNCLKIQITHQKHFQNIKKQLAKDMW